jgi:hypothetical protein
MAKKTTVAAAKAAADQRPWAVNQSDIGPLVGVAIRVGPGVEQKVADFSNLEAAAHARRAVVCRNAMIGVRCPAGFRQALVRALTLMARDDFPALQRYGLRGIAKTLLAKPKATA